MLETPLRFTFYCYDEATAYSEHCLVQWIIGDCTWRFSAYNDTFICIVYHHAQTS